MKLLIWSGLLVAAFSSGTLAAPVVTKIYSYSDDGSASRDTACVTAMLEEIMPNFDGVQKVILSANAIFETQDGYLAIYPGAEFESLYGYAEGTINCIFTSDGKSVTEVAVTFEGAGLAGFTRHPLAVTLNDLARQTSTGMSSSIIPH